MVVKKALLEQLESFEADMKWLSQHYESLRQRYPDQYVAVLHRVVVDHDADLKKLMRRLEAKYPGKSGSMAVEYIAAKKVDLIL
jgi:hypothetical protein